MTRLYLGVDAGNSKTVAVVCDEEGVVRGWGRAGIGDIYGAPDEATAVTNVLAAARQALAAAGVDGADLDRAGVDGTGVTAAFCLAGADWPEDHAFWTEVLTRELPHLAQVSVRNDGFATLRAGATDGTGVAIAVGTGPSVVARGPQGVERCLGWWCFDHLGGSGLVERGLRAVYLAHQGLGPATVLTEQLLGLYGVGDVAALRHATTRRTDPVPVQGRPGAARTVLAAAQAGDAAAVALVEDQARAFTGYAAWVATEAGFDVDHDAVPVVLGGSVATSDIPAMRDALTARLRARMPHAVLHVIDRPPVLGAVLQAAADDDPRHAGTLAGSLSATTLAAEVVTTD